MYAHASAARQHICIALTPTQTPNRPQCKRVTANHITATATMLLTVVRRAMNGVNIIPSNPPSLTAPAASRGCGGLSLVPTAAHHQLTMQQTTNGRVADASASTAVSDVNRHNSGC